MEGVMQIAIGGTVISKPTSRALKDVETRIARGGPALESLRSERDYYRGEIDDALITGWESVMAAHMQARKEAARSNAELLEITPEYVAATRREQARWDLEQERYDAGC
jgi:hypothetical protein